MLLNKRRHAARMERLCFKASALTGDSKIIFLAGLSPGDRDEIAHPAERRAAIALRKTGIMASKVRAALACSATELDRWDADGRLPHLYVGMVILRFGKATLCRFWASGAVEAAKLNLSAWREQDSTRKIFSRRGIRAVRSPAPQARSRSSQPRSPVDV